MLSPKFATVALAALAGTGGLCLCGAGPSLARADQPAALAAAAVAADTSVARLHISGMTCGSCPITARAALRKITGVFSAKVTLDDSLGVVKYDPARVTPAAIASRLTEMTGYGAKVLADAKKAGSAGGQ